jgi:thymidylate synthase ThyX
MKVTQIGIRPTEASNEAGRPSLTPELLAACGARYSRSNDGLEAILAKIDPANLDKSVDSIFKMLDYGHQSIADMVPVAMFIDGISIWLAYYVWSLCPTAGGQESSTRYIKLSVDEIIEPEVLGIREGNIQQWRETIGKAFQAYQSALEIWEGIAAEDPSVARIPQAILNDPSEKAQRQVARMRRNYGFDRARYYLPVAAGTNMMLLMPARGWAALCQNLLSHPLLEANTLGNAIRDELRLSAPRMLKHAEKKESSESGIWEEFRRLVAEAEARFPETLDRHSPSNEAAATASLEIGIPRDISEADFLDDLKFHNNRYAWIGERLRRTLVRFGWNAVAFAEIRDLNRHRTGTKFCPLRPLGFYGALDQVPQPQSAEYGANLQVISKVGREASAISHSILSEKDPTYIYWTLLGTQYLFEHATTADKFIYEAELRTGTGAHYRYANHLRDVLSLWYEKFPQTKGLLLEGAAEPE